MNLQRLDEIRLTFQDCRMVTIPIDEDDHKLIHEVIDELRKRLVAEEAGKKGVIHFVCKGGVWHLTAAMIKDYEDTFVDMDVIHEANAARLWCNANPAKRKTKGGMPKFLNGWLSRSNDKGQYRKRGEPKPEGELRNATVEDVMLAYGLTEEEAEKRMSE